MSENRNKRKALLKILGIAAFLAAIGVVALPFVVDANQFRPILESRLSGALGRAVKVGNLKISLWSGSIGADDLAIADDPSFSATPFIRARSLRVGVEMKPLIFSRALHVTSIALDNPEVTLVRNPSGEWNFSALAAEAGTAPAENQKGKGRQDPGVSVSIGSLAIANGRVAIVRGDRRLKPYLFEGVDITAKNLSFASVFPFALTAKVPGGGSAKLEGKAGPLNSADLSLTPLEVSFNLTHFDPVGSGFVDAFSGLGGVLNFKCNLVSDGREVRVKGSAGVDRLQLVKAGSPATRPVALDWALRHDIKNQAGVLEDTRVTYGNAVAHLGGQYDLRGDAFHLKVRLRGEGLPVQDLEALLPAVGIVLPRGATLQGGTLSVNADTEGPVENMVSTGTVVLSGTRLTGYDLGRQLATVASLVGIKTGPSTDIERLAGEVRLTPTEIKVTGFKLIAPSLGQMSGDGVVGSNRSLDFKMMARLIPSGGLAGGLARLTGSQYLTVPFLIRGTTEDPKFVPDVKGAAGTLLNSSPGKEEGSVGGILKNLLGKKVIKN